MSSFVLKRIENLQVIHANKPLRDLFTREQIELLAAVLLVRYPSADPTAQALGSEHGRLMLMSQQAKHEVAIVFRNEAIELGEHDDADHVQ